MILETINKIAINNPFPAVQADHAAWTAMLNFVFGVVGALCLLMITIGAFRYVISRGEPQEIAKAKNTILYAAIGLVVSVSAIAIVSFVVTQAAL